MKKLDEVELSLRRAAALSGGFKGRELALILGGLVLGGGIYWLATRHTAQALPENRDPLGLTSPNQRQSLYTDAEVAQATDKLVKGEILIPPGEPLYFQEPPRNGKTRILEGQTIDALYQLFGGYGLPNFVGGLVCECFTLSNLLEGGEEYSVLHQWGRKFDGSDTENALIMSRLGDSAVFTPYIQDIGGWQPFVGFPGSYLHTFRLGVNALHPYGSRAYDRVLMWVWDLTAGQCWSGVYPLPQPQLTKDVDMALEQVVTQPPNDKWQCYEVRGVNEVYQYINLPRNFYYLEYPWAAMRNEHIESWYDDVGYLYQRKATL